MKKDIIVVTDTNILFTFFWKISSNPEILIDRKQYLIAPEFALKEIKKYSTIIKKKANISDKEFKIIWNDLFLGITFFPEEEYKKYLVKAKNISPDIDDIDFFALALMYKCPIWSNDRNLKEQNDVDVLDTKEMIELLD